ncbi:tripartite tricarboxylate transporter TctB family protein [Leptolyngbya sp. 15MV]|nr:tripartite tricarboxylate transporter TctB family protein [Leptolyngbya sp. 15MV]
MIAAGRHANRAIAATVAAVAGIAFAGTFWFDPVPPGLPGLGAAEFPRLICLVILGLAALLAMQAPAPVEDPAPPLDRGAWSVFAACALFLPAMALLGFWAASAVFLFLAGRIWGEVSLKTLALHAVLLTAALWLIFVWIFRLTLPAGQLGTALGF